MARVVIFAGGRLLLLNLWLRRIILIIKTMPFICIRFARSVLFLLYTLVAFMLLSIILMSRFVWLLFVKVCLSDFNRLASTIISLRVIMALRRVSNFVSLREMYDATSTLPISHMIMYTFFENNQFTCSNSVD